MSELPINQNQKLLVTLAVEMVAANGELSS